MRLVLMGPPGAGKGTQLLRLQEIYGIHSISTGEILREQIMLKTELGLSIEGTINGGSYVADDIVLSLVRERITSAEYDNGFIFDGFPRTVAQADELWKILEENELMLDQVVSIEVPDETIVTRMSGRLTCPGCDRSYHATEHPPQKGNSCDICGTELIIREDDKAETVQKRLQIYRELTEPIIDYYDRRGLLLRVNGIGEISGITNEIVSKLRER